MNHIVRRIGDAIVTTAIVLGIGIVTTVLLACIYVVYLGGGRP
jgi:multisubunit Na+/H+ antiporter MnhC subunit